MTFKRSNLKKGKEMYQSIIDSKRNPNKSEKNQNLGTCKPVAALKTETVFPVQTRSFLASLENDGGEVT